MTDADPRAPRSGMAHKAAASALVLVSILLALFIVFAWAFPWAGCIQSLPAAQDCFNVGGMRGCVPRPGAPQSGCHPNALAGLIALVLLGGGWAWAAKVWRG